MDNLLTIAFEAHNSEKNHHRRCQLTLGRDLLDDWTLSVGHGRVGQGGQNKLFASAEVETIQAIVRARLRRRLSAPRRIGCCYRLMKLDVASGFDATAWFPEELLAGFERGSINQG